MRGITLATCFMVAVCTVSYGNVKKQPYVLCDNLPSEVAIHQQFVIFGTGADKSNIITVELWDTDFEVLLSGPYHCNISKEGAEWTCAPEWGSSYTYTVRMFTGIDRATANDAIVCDVTTK